MTTTERIAAGLLALALPAAAFAIAALDAPMVEQQQRAELERHPGAPRALYELAAALARQGKTEPAFDLLQRLAAMGLALDPGTDIDFAGLRGRERFQKIQAELKANARPQGRARTAFQVQRPGFFPEGIAYDAERGRFFLGSVHARRVVAVDRKLRSADFGAAADGLWSVLGMTVHGRELWLAESATPAMTGAAPELAGRTGLAVLDLDSGRLKARYPLPPENGKDHFFGDVAVSASGHVFTTDSIGGGFYELDPASGNYRLLANTLRSPQGMAIDEARGRVYLSDYNLGLLRFDLADGRLQPVGAPDDACVYGIDGLYWDRGALVAVQNGVFPYRVLRLELDAAGANVTRAAVLASGLPQFNEPTLGVIVGRSFYFVANSLWDRKPGDGERELARVMSLRLP